MRAMSKGNWYPSRDELKDQVALERSMRRVLQEVYKLKDKMEAPATEAAPSKGTSTLSTINGLPVLPFDPSRLADGTKLTWVAAKRRFEVK